MFAGSFWLMSTRGAIRPAKSSFLDAPCVGAWLGWAGALLETLHLSGRPGSVVAPGDLLEAALLYAALGLVFGLLLSIGGWVAFRRPPAMGLAAAVLLALFAFLLIGGYVNLYHLPEAASRATLLYTGLMFLAAGLAGIGFHLLLRRMGRFLPPLSHRARRGAWIGLALLFAVTAAISLAPRRRASPAVALVKAPEINVLILTADALRPDHLSLYGYRRETSPSLDAWARQGVIFENAFAQSSWTKPSTATILTGLYPSVHRVNLTASGLPRTAESIFEMLARAGYATGLFSANGFVTPLFGFGRGVERVYAPVPPHFAQFMLGHLLYRAMEWSAALRRFYRELTGIERFVRGERTPRGGLRAEGLTQAFLDWLDGSSGAIGVRGSRPAGEPATAPSPSSGESAPPVQSPPAGQLASTAQPARPFCAYIHYMETHVPYAPPPPEDERFLPERLRGMPPVTDFPRYPGFLPFEKARPVSSDSLANMVALYDGSILHLDRWVGTLIEELKQRDLFDHTLIIFTADHGEEFHLEHGGWGHGQSLFEELLRVPLIVSCPPLFGATGEAAGGAADAAAGGSLPPGDGLRGRRVAGFVRHVDLVPTILDICGVAPAGELNGESFRPLMLGATGPAVEMRPLYSEVDHGGHFAYALRLGWEKSIYSRRGADERFLLFDLASDPAETQDLSSREPERAAVARAALEAFREAVRRAAREEVTVTIDQATRERLRALGYIR